MSLQIFRLDTAVTKLGSKIYLCRKSTTFAFNSTLSNTLKTKLITNDIFIMLISRLIIIKCHQVFFFLIHFLISDSFFFHLAVQRTISTGSISILGIISQIDPIRNVAALHVRIPLIATGGNRLSRTQNRTCQNTNAQY